jgi:disulfide bond formation protein DsbB
LNLTPAVTLGLSLLTVVALAAVAGVIALAVAARVSDSMRGLLDRLEDAAAADGLRLAWIVALVATAGSLYMSEVAHFVPCTLCWYQRIAMYPLVLVLGVGALRNDGAAVRYAMPLAIIGAPISLYHYAIETFPSLAGTVACDPSNPCTLVWFRELGVVTLPLMAFAAFGLVWTLLALTAAGRAAGIEAPGAVRSAPTAVEVRP